MMSEQDMERLDPNEQSDHDLISTDILEDICDGSQTHPNVNLGHSNTPYIITTILNTLCKPFTMIRVYFNAPFHSGCLCFIKSRIL